jgi:hypothetical protein
MTHHPTLAKRRGPRPTTTSTAPHTQLDQQPVDDTIRQQLADRVFALPGVHQAPSAVSVPGAHALVLSRDPSLEPEATTGPAEAFLAGREFAHLHPAPDQSLHLTLPHDLVHIAIEAGWAEVHPLVAAGRLPPTHVMVYAPRDTKELEVVTALVAASHRFATGPGTRPSR